MVLDTSVIVAILVAEPEEDYFLERMRRAPTLIMSAFSVLEAAVALMRHSSGDLEHRLDSFLLRAGVDVVPVDERQVVLARDAYRRFGRSRHPAALNLGDCFSYALAALTGEPLLFKGNDFSKTDIPIA